MKDATGVLSADLDNPTTLAAKLSDPAAMLTNRRVDMDIAFGLVGLVLIIWAVVACVRPRKTQRAGSPRFPATTPVSRPVAQRPWTPPDRPWTPPDPVGVGDPIGGWLVGHHVAHDHDGYPGDPLPNGHLGSPADLAFWGSVFDEDDRDEW
jgi:hypothetical protein